MKPWTLIVLAALACGPASPDAVERPPPVRVLSAEPLRVEVRVGSDDSMRFDVESFEVPAGSEVHLVFSNGAVKPMYHNWVLVRRPAEEDVLNLGVQAGFEAGWVPEHPAILVATPALRPGEETTLVFPAPPAGSYPYLCTVPGHRTMRGVMRVRGEGRGRRP